MFRKKFHAKTQRSRKDAKNATWSPTGFAPLRIFASLRENFYVASIVRKVLRDSNHISISIAVGPTRNNAYSGAFTT
jgi:hypothetical protein